MPCRIGKPNGNKAEQRPKCKVFHRVCQCLRNAEVFDKTPDYSYNVLIL